MSALDLIDIKKTYGTVEILKKINISLEDGEFLVLLGASGCGKSTLLNIIAGLADPTAGEVRIDGTCVNGMAPKDRDIAMVFQSYALYPNLTVARNIGFGLEMRGVARAARAAAVQKVAAMLKIEDLLNRKPAQLSGGQRQRVAIGRALVRNPRIFLFDEPLSNLDAKLRMEMRAELKRLHRLLGTTIVYVTHDQIEAMTLATRIAVMRDGNIDQIGTPEDIYNRPATLFVAEFVGSPPMNMLNATLDADGLRLDGAQTPLSLPGKALPLTDRPRKLVLGLRPEDIHLATDADALVIEATADILDLTGPELVVSAFAGEQRVIASLPPHTRIAPDDRLRFGFSADNLHLFDRETRRRIMVP
ncbi:MAG: sn-glycerol-3-phosphate ABC transporter ATP-binding protein UgpC [Paracoccaceae bacterium]|nr:sn-glycerol-3-phosphate ABC transporter ATP-binding protein UgpC [Paracoccaceae bacterium]